MTASVAGPEPVGGGDGNRTRVSCVGSRCSAIELHHRLCPGQRPRTSRLSGPPGSVKEQPLRVGLEGRVGVEPHLLRLCLPVCSHEHLPPIFLQSGPDPLGPL